jgi:hypothetical protein
MAGFMYMKSTSLSKYTNQLAKESYVVNCQGDADSYNIQIMLVSKFIWIWFDSWCLTPLSAINWQCNIVVKT